MDDNNTNNNQLDNNTSAFGTQSSSTRTALTKANAGNPGTVTPGDITSGVYTRDQDGYEEINVADTTDFVEGNGTYEGNTSDTQGNLETIQTEELARNGIKLPDGAQEKLDDTFEIYTSEAAPDATRNAGDVDAVDADENIFSPLNPSGDNIDDLVNE